MTIKYQVTLKLKCEILVEKWLLKESSGAENNDSTFELLIKKLHNLLQRFPDDNLFPLLNAVRDYTNAHFEEAKFLNIYMRVYKEKVLNIDWSVRRVRVILRRM